MKTLGDVAQRVAPIEGEPEKKVRGPLVHLVGMLNPYGADPRYALYDEPENASGYRLRTLIFGLQRRTYLNDALFTRRNLCVLTGRWNRLEARQTYEDLLRELEPGDLVVALGREVALVDVRKPAPFQLADIRSKRAWILALPHPSGLCREWRDPAAVPRARNLLRSVASHVYWGELTGGSP